MIAIARGHRMRGQAAVEALLAFSILGIFLHAVMDLGALNHEIQRASHISRLAAFTGIADVPNAGNASRSPINVVLSPIAEPQGISQSWRAGHGDTSPDGSRVEDSDASVLPALAQDWLGPDPALRRATATVGAMRARDTKRGLLPSIQRHLVIASNAGTGLSDVDVARRLQASEQGWAMVAKPSAESAERLAYQLGYVAAPGRSSAWYGEWVEAWRDLPASRQQNPEVNSQDGRIHEQAD
jgi:hypothetical protein